MERIRRAAAVFGIHVAFSDRDIRYVIAAILALTMLPGQALAAGTFTSASVALSDARPSATSDYTFTGSSVDTATAINCVQVIWSTTASGNTAPSGFSGATGSINAASSTLIGSSGSGWSLSKSDGTGSSGQNNIYQYTNSTGYTPSSSTDTFVVTGATNPSSSGTAYFYQIATFANTNCSSSLINDVTISFTTTTGPTMSMTVNPTLSFSVNSVASGQSCAGGTTSAASTATAIAFGTVTPATNALVCQDLTAATNATSGYTVYARYTAAPVNQGGHNLADLTPGTNSSPAAFSAAGVEAYGYNTNDQALSTCSGSCNANRFYNGTTYSWAAMTTTNSEVAYETAPTSGTYRIAHQVGIADATPAGNYSTTIIYTCTPVF